jgi:hypothetical protein
MRFPKIKPSGKDGFGNANQSLNFKAKLKLVVVQLACYGLIPLVIADWIIQAGGMNHD